MKLASIAVAGAFVVAVGAAVVWNVNRPPVGHSMEVPDLSSVPDGGPIADVRVPAQLSANATIGKRIFEAKCAVCHGQNAAGTNGTAPPLIHTFYRPGHHADIAFVRAARLGVQAHHWNFGNMPPVEGLTDGDIKMLTQYIRELQVENGIR